MALNQNDVRWLSQVPPNEHVQTIVDGVIWDINALTNNRIHWYFDQTNWTGNQAPSMYAGITQALSLYSSVTGIGFVRELYNQADAELVFAYANNNPSNVTNGTHINSGGVGGYPGEAKQRNVFTYYDDTTRTVVTTQTITSEPGQSFVRMNVDGNAGFDAANNPYSNFDSAGNLTQYGLGSLFHEVGHALGLKHPHNDSIDSEVNMAPGARLDDKLYTIMSYNYPDQQGAVLGLGALDIAALQYMYGVNTTHNPGNNTYWLPDTTSSSGLNVADGASWYGALWDTDGVDEIKYAGTANAVIDLRPATLDDDPIRGGGTISYTYAPSRVGTLYGRGGTIAADFMGAIPDENGVTGVIIENATGGDGDDNIRGNDVANVLNGGDGTDRLTGYAGADTLDGGDGDDTMRGGTDRDTFRFVDITFGHDIIEDFEVGLDQIEFEVKGLYSLSQLQFGESPEGFARLTFGNNSVTFQNVTKAHLEAVASSIKVTVPVPDTLLSFSGTVGTDADELMLGNANQTLHGGGGNDWIEAGSGRNNLYGDGGDDTLLAGKSDFAWMEGGEGDDTLVGGSGFTVMFGNAGNDRMIGSLNAGNSMYAGAGDDEAIGGNQTDWFYDEGGNDIVRMGGGDDVISDDYGSNKLYGEAGNDRISSGTAEGALLDGGDGDDTLFASMGGNTLIGGNGNDRLEVQEGGPVANLFTGGEGADTFVYRPGVGVESNVIVTDFQDGIDHIGLLSWTNRDLVHVTDTADGALITYYDDHYSPMLLAGISASQINQDDFLLV